MAVVPATNDFAPPQSRAGSLPRAVLTRSRSLQFWLACLALACILPACIAVGGLITRSYLRERAITAAGTVLTARALSQLIDHELVRIQTTLQVLGTAHTLAVGDLANFYTRAQAVVPIVGATDIALSDTSGQELVDTLRPFGTVLPHLANMEAWRRVIATGEPVIATRFVEPIPQSEIVSIDVPVFAAGKITAILHAGITSEHFADILLRQRAPSSWIIGILDSNATVVARTRNAQDFVGRKTTPAVLQRLAKADQGAFSSSTLEGIDVLSVFSRSSLTHWTILIGIPDTVLTAGLKLDLWFSIAAGGLLVAIGAMASSMISQRIAWSIRALAEPAEALAMGKPVSVPKMPVLEVMQIGNALAAAAELMAQRTIDHAKIQAAEHRIEVSEQIVARLTVMMDAAPDAMIKIDSEGRIVRLNDRAEALFGYDRQELLGQSIECLIAERFRTDRPGDVNVLFLNPRRQKRGSALFGRRKDGTEFPVEVSMNQLELDGAPFISIAARDITERRELEAAVEAGRAQAVATARLAALGTMAGGIAHEINNPLAVIHALADDLSDQAERGDLPSEHAMQSARRITRLSERIAKIIKSLGYLARDGAGDGFVEASLSDIVVQALDVCEPRFRGSPVALEISSIDPGLRIACREVQISQILVNLLQNAFDAARDSVADHWVRLDAASQGDHAVVAVIDSGNGVPPGLKERIMEPFFTTKPLGQGTGLGLSLSLQMAEQHGGRIELTERGGHTCFTLSLPLAHERVTK